MRSHWRHRHNNQQKHRLSGKPTLSSGAILIPTTSPPLRQSARPCSMKSTRCIGWTLLASWTIKALPLCSQPGSNPWPPTRHNSSKQSTIIRWRKWAKHGQKQKRTDLHFSYFVWPLSVGLHPDPVAHCAWRCGFCYTFFHSGLWVPCQGPQLQPLKALQ